MPRYAPLPVVSIDPRNEAELVQEASQRVYDASNQTLNDFSSGNPLAALIEGQAFAQGEFLFWANQLPEKILLDDTCHVGQDELLQTQGLSREADAPGEVKDLGRRHRCR